MADGTLSTCAGKEDRRILTSFAEGFGVSRGLAREIGDAAAREARSRGNFADSLLAVAAASGAGDGECVFVSTPITRGRAYLEWRRDNLEQSEDLLQFDVMAANRRAAREVVARVRNAHHDTVIDPTRLLDIPGWTQPDYHELWRRVIIKFAHTMVMGNGWEYSVGCAKEYAIAVQMAMPTLASDLVPFDVTTGRRMLASAAARYVEANLDPTCLRDYIP